MTWFLYSDERKYTLTALLFQQRFIHITNMWTRGIWLWRSRPERNRAEIWMCGGSYWRFDSLEATINCNGISLGRTKRCLPSAKLSQSALHCMLRNPFLWTTRTSTRSQIAWWIYSNTVRIGRSMGLLLSQVVPRLHGAKYLLLPKKAKRAVTITSIFSKLAL